MLSIEFHTIERANLQNRGGMDKKSPAVMFIFGIHDCVQRAATQRQTHQTRITINPPRICY